MTNYRNRTMGSRSKQQGFATLVASLMLMFLITFNVFMGAKASVIAQQTVTSMYLSDIAFNRAEEGIAAMKAQLIPSLTNKLPITVANAYMATYDDATKVITSTGYAPDSTVKVLTQRLILTTSSTTTAGGGAALKAAKNVTLSGSTSSTSTIAGGTITGDSGLRTENAAEFQTSDAGGVRALTSDEVFMRFYSPMCPISKAANVPSDCKAEAYTKLTTGSLNSVGYVCLVECDKATLAAQYAAGKRIFWVTAAGIKINGNTTLGTTNDPAIVLLMSGGRINGTMTVYGAIYVDGDWTNGGGGNATVYGTAVTSGNFTGTGNTAFVETDVTLKLETQNWMTNVSDAVGGSVAGVTTTTTTASVDTKGWSD